MAACQARLWAVTHAAPRASSEPPKTAETKAAKSNVHEPHSGKQYVKREPPSGKLYQDNATPAAGPKRHEAD